MNIIEGICGKVAPGMCRLGMNGSIAVRTSSGYRMWDADNRRLINCDGFAVDLGEDFFFVLPTNKVRPGDIILSGGMPVCVLSADGDTVTAVHFESAAVQTLVPERHLFMGNTYLFGKIVSLFGASGARGKKGAGRMMKYMMISSMLRGKENGTGNMLPLIMLGGGSDWMDGLFEELNGDEDGKEA